MDHNHVKGAIGRCQRQSDRLADRLAEKELSFSIVKASAVDCPFLVISAFQ
jgi:hypothetical protein